LPNQSCKAGPDVALRSPAPQASARFTIALGGCFNFEQPTINSNPSLEKKFS